MGTVTNELVLSDAATLRVLSHPVRLKILAYLQSHGSGTATACGKAVGLSSSACSYHLRLMAEHGYVEEVPERSDHRTTMWRPRVETLLVQPRDPAAQEAAVPLEHMLVNEAFMISRRYLDQLGNLDESWQRAAGHSYWRLDLTAEELAAMRRELDAVLARWRDRQADQTGDTGPDRRRVFLTVGGVVEFVREEARDD